MADLVEEDPLRARGAAPPCDLAVGAIEEHLELREDREQRPPDAGKQQRGAGEEAEKRIISAVTPLAVIEVRRGCRSVHRQPPHVERARPVLSGARHDLVRLHHLPQLLSVGFFERGSSAVTSSMPLYALTTSWVGPSISNTPLLIQMVRSQVSRMDPIECETRKMVPASLAISRIRARSASGKLCRPRREPRR